MTGFIFCLFIIIYIFFKLIVLVIINKTDDIGCLSYVFVSNISSKINKSRPK